LYYLEELDWIHQLFPARSLAKEKANLPDAQAAKAFIPEA
jgi:hypothetical protein